MCFRILVTTKLVNTITPIVAEVITSAIDTGCPPVAGRDATAAPVVVAAASICPPPVL
jgi:hypothetical protein